MLSTLQSNGKFSTHAVFVNNHTMFSCGIQDFCPNSSKHLSILIPTIQIRKSSRTNSMYFSLNLQCCKRETIRLGIHLHWNTHSISSLTVEVECFHCETSGSFG